MKQARLRPAARSDLARIWDYGAERWDKESADRYVRDIDSELQKAAKSPLRGSARDWVMPGLRKWTVRNHHAFFLITDTGIDVLRILHPSMDVGWAIPGGE